MSDTRTAADLARRTQEMVRTVETLLEKMELRKWAVRRTIEAMKESQFASTADFISCHVEMAEKFHAFVSKPALEAVEVIESVKPPA